MHRPKKESGEPQEKESRDSKSHGTTNEEKTSASVFDITNRKQVEEILLDNAQLYRSLIESFALAVWETNAEGKIVKDNASWQNCTGQTYDEYKGDGWLEAVHPDDRESAIRQWQQAINSRQPLNAKFRLKFAKNGYRWTNILANPIFDHQGNTARWSAMTIDIHERVEAEEALRKSEKELKELTESLGHKVDSRTRDVKKVEDKLKEESHLINQIMETTPDIVYITDLNTKQLIFSNRNIPRSLGYSKQQINNMSNPIFDIMHPEDIPKMIEHFKIVKSITTDDKIIEIEYRLKKQKGGFRWFKDRNSVFKRNKQRIPVEKIGICQDITEIKENEENSKTAVDIMRQAEQIVDIGSWEYIIESGEFKWSHGMYRLFNLSPSEVVAPQIYVDYCIESDRQIAKKIVNSITQMNQAFEETITIILSGEQAKVIHIKAIVQKDLVGTPSKVIGVDLDITGQVKANENIQVLYQTLLKKNEELERMNKEVRTFNMVTAHDYKETLQQLYTNLEYIVTKDARNLSDTGKANIRRAQSSIQKMNLLTDDINSYFSLYDMDLPLNISDTNKILEKVVEKYARKLEQANGKVESMDLVKIPTHPALFAQLIGNLIDNSIKFRKSILPLVITVKCTRADELNSIPKALKDCPYTIISVSDNGIGFDEAESEKLFDLFYRGSNNTKSKGSGIGLAVCTKIMSMHNGFITGESVLANGATFSCYFPLETEAV